MFDLALLNICHKLSVIDQCHPNLHWSMYILSLCCFCWQVYCTFTVTSHIKFCVEFHACCCCSV